MTVEQRVERLERLERRSRWMRRAWGLAIACVACVVLMGPPKRHPPIMKTGVRRAKQLPDLVVRSLVVADKNNNMRIGLGTRHDSSPLLRLFAKDGKARAELAMYPDGQPALTFSDKDGVARASLLTRAGGLPAVSLLDKNGNVRAALAMNDDGSTSLTLSDKDGKERAVLGAMTIVNKSIRAETTTGENSLTLYDAKGNVIWQAPR